MKNKFFKYLTIFLLLIITACGKNIDPQTNKVMQKKLRYPAVAGQFYSDDKDVLLSEIAKHLSDKDKMVKERVRAILVPHAGYDFSGNVAAYAYNEIKYKEYNNEFIICNSHAAFFEGISVDDSDVWVTPLGDVEVNHDMAQKLVNESDIINFNSQAHDRDHSLEVQLPFLQTVIRGDFKIIPILFGSTNGGHEALEKALYKLVDDDDLIVISTDMSHYPEYDVANEIDKETLAHIARLDIKALEGHIGSTEARHVPNEETLLCGVDGVKTIMGLASIFDWTAKNLFYANSGDTKIGEKERVVGYGAVVFFGESNKKTVKEAESGFSVDLTDALTPEQKEMLREIAKTTVEGYITKGQIPKLEIKDDRLLKKEGAFVTIKKRGELRGCIGQIIPSGQPLWRVVQDMAIAAAIDDPRFEKVNRKELDSLSYEISVLSPPEQINDWKKIRLGEHGVIVKQGFNSGVFLPQVADETGWSLEEFLSQLCYQKAGLPPTCYKDSQSIELKVFTAQVF